MFSKMSCVVRLAGRKGVSASGRRRLSQATSQPGEKLFTYNPERMSQALADTNTFLQQRKELVAVAIAGLGGAIVLSIAATSRFYSLSERAIGAEANARAAASAAEAATARAEKAAADSRAEIANNRADLEVRRLNWVEQQVAKALAQPVVKRKRAGN